MMVEVCILALITFDLCMYEMSLMPSRLLVC